MLYGTSKLRFGHSAGASCRISDLSHPKPTMSAEASGTADSLSSPTAGVEKGAGTPRAERSSSVAMMEFPMDDSVPLPVTPQNNHSSATGGLFFADATLDLDEAHDIAETPEPQKLVMTASAAPAAIPSVEIPTLASSPTPPTSKEAIITKLGPNTGNLMNRIDSGGRGSVVSNQQPTHRPRPPRRPRDIPWLVGFIVVVPLSLLIASCLSTDTEEGSLVATSKASRRSSFYGLILAFGAAQIFARLMYRTMGGGDGEDARHVASQVILAFAPISLGVHCLILVCMYLRTSNALSWSIIPLWFLARDIFAMRQWRTTASTAGGRQAFFQALCNMALDILSRSLRRSSFYRMVGALVGVQLCVIWWWRSALLGALRHGSTFWLIVVLVSGKWASSVVARLLGLVASGGVTNWFVQQTLVMEEMERQEAEHNRSDEDGHSRDMTVPEEYRAADASVYRRVELDDGIDDDYTEEDGKQSNATMASMWSETSNSTVLSLLRTAVFVSFGSVAQCGLLGGLAQFVWSIVRNADAMTNAVSQRFPSSSRTGFRGMQIGQDSVEHGLGMCYKICGRLNVSARSFVRSHTDLALCQVAAYYKSYQRAALDVSILVDGSGMEPIVHDDVTVRIRLAYG